VSPWIFGFVVFTLGPMLASLFFSFTQYNVLSPARWVGVRNYSTLVTIDSANMEKAFSNATYLAVVGVPLSVATGLAIALLLNAGVRGMRFYRTAFYMPAIVPTIASAVLWLWLLTPDPTKGLINAGWAATLTPWLGAKAPGWANAEEWAKPALIFMGMWGAGSSMILWLAGIKGVPTTLYEAASIDGATPSRQFWNVTLPQLSPIIFFNLVMGFIGALQEFDRIYVMNQGGDGSVGPADSLLSPVFYLFNNGFKFFKMGYASAIAWAIFLVILLLTLIQFRLAPRWVHYEVEK
jgi:multiple sugar transport system permease protein